MPICKRSIQPVDISRKVVLKGVTDELECVSNSTMVHIVLQLSSLSKLSEDIFSELHLETCQLFYRTCKVIQKVELLKHQIIILNPTAEEVSLRDINQRKPFKSMLEKDQEVITTMTRPAAINDVYDSIDPPPTLYLLDPYREDGKQSMKFYTDPDYFFELWKQEVAKDAKNQMKKQKGKLKKRPTKDLDPDNRKNNSKMSHELQTSFAEELVISPQNGKFINQESLMIERGPFINSNLGRDKFPNQEVLPNMFVPGWNPNVVSNKNSNQFPLTTPTNVIEHESHFLPDDYYFQHSKYPAMVSADQYIDPYITLPHQQQLFNSSFPSPPNFGSPLNETLNDSNYFPPPPLPQNLTEHSSDQFIGDNNDGFNFSEGVQDLLNLIEGTPPRNIDAMNGNQINFESGKPELSANKTPNFPADNQSPLKSSDQIMSMSPSRPLIKTSASFEREVSPDRSNPAYQKIVRDTRSDLLEAIRKGIQLRKVEERRMITERRTTARFDVQSIMEAAFELRRKNMENNESDDDDDDAGGWSDDA